MDTATIAAGRGWSCPMYQALVSSKRPVFHLLNPSDSGIVIRVWRLEANCEVSAYWTVRQHNEDPYADRGSPCNMRFGAGGIGAGNPSKAILSMANVSTIPGNAHSEFYRVGGRPLILEPSTYPILHLDPGKGMLIACHSTGDACCAPEWSEESE